MTIYEIVNPDFADLRVRFVKKSDADEVARRMNVYTYTSKIGYRVEEATVFPSISEYEKSLHPVTRD